MRRPNRDRLPPPRQKLAFEPLEPREMLAADAGVDWWAVDTGYDPAADEWVWQFDDSWNSGGDGGDLSETDGWWVDDGAADPAADLGGAADIDAPAVPADDVAFSAPDGAEPDSSFIEDPVVTETPVVTDETPPVRDELPIATDDLPAVEDATPAVEDETPAVAGPTPTVGDESPIVTDEPTVSDGDASVVTDDQPVIEDVPVTEAFDDTASVGDPTPDAEPAAATPEPVAGPDTVPSGPVPHVPKAMDGTADGPRATWAAGPGSAASQAGPTAMPLAAPDGGGRTTGAWGRLLGMFGLPANADANSATGLQANGQDATGKPRVRLPFRPAA